MNNNYRQQEVKAEIVTPNHPYRFIVYSQIGEMNKIEIDCMTNDYDTNTCKVFTRSKNVYWLEKDSLIIPFLDGVYYYNDGDRLVHQVMDINVVNKSYVITTKIFKLLQ